MSVIHIDIEKIIDGGMEALIAIRDEMRRTGKSAQIQITATIQMADEGVLEYIAASIVCRANGVETPEQAMMAIVRAGTAGIVGDGASDPDQPELRRQVQRYLEIEETDLPAEPKKTRTDGGWHAA